MVSRKRVAPSHHRQFWCRWPIGLLCALTLLLAACGAGDSTSDSANLQITLLPITTGSDTASVQLRDSTEKPITDASVTLEANMNHAGMVPVLSDAVTDSADGASDGVYTAPLSFSMLGDWIITVTVTRPDGTEATKDFHLTVTDGSIQIHDTASAETGQPDSQAAGLITVQDAVMRAVPLAGGNGAIYFTLTNNTAQADRLVSVESAVADTAEMHESVDENNVVRMEPRPDGFALPAGETVALTPGGKHIMLMKLAQPLGEGESMTVTLHFDHAEPQIVTVPVVALGASLEQEHQHGK
jgi:periplasmic copper chaperone A